jgi:hypothetical protein
LLEASVDQRDLWRLEREAADRRKGDVETRWRVPEDRSWVAASRSAERPTDVYDRWYAEGDRRWRDEMRRKNPAATDDGLYAKFGGVWDQDRRAEKDRVIADGFATKPPDPRDSLGTSNKSPPDVCVPIRFRDWGGPVLYARCPKCGADVDTTFRAIASPSLISGRIFQNCATTGCSGFYFRSGDCYNLTLEG